MSNDEVQKTPADKVKEALEKEAVLKAKPEAKAKAKKAAVEEKVVVEEKPAVEEPVVEVEFSYVSKDREPMFKVLYPGGGWRPALMNDGRLMWKISATDKDRFEAHHHFQVGRIVRHHD